MSPPPGSASGPDGNGLPVITSPLTITSQEAKATIIQGTGRFRILQVAETGTLTLQGLTLRGGFTFPDSIGFRGW